MATTPTYINQRINNLQALINDIATSGVPTTSDLAVVLANGNSAGVNDINMDNNDITNGGTITATSFVGALTGNATSATNLQGGLGGSIPYQTAVDTTALLPNGTAGQVLTSNGTTIAPSWTTPSGGASSLSATLVVGNSAGTTDVDMNSQDILNVNNITVASPYNFSVVSIFVDATARDTALPTPYTGQMCFLSGSNKVQYWNVNWYNVNVQPNTPIITGFTLTTQYEIIYLNASNTVITAPTLDGYTVVRFYPTSTTSGTITIPNTVSTDYLVVGGGGGGGGGAFITFNGAGGGAGGLLTATDLFVASTSYSVSVGQGGTAGAIATTGGSGANSSLVVNSGLKTATGGGGGGGGVVGVSGGSGGGGGWNTVVIAGGAGTLGQGNSGGSSTTSPAYPYSGGGGGASAVGSSAVGSGGAGTSSSITGSAVIYAGGGGGGASTGIGLGANPVPVGGSGGGGNGGYFSGSAVAPVAGINGRGGGGGGRGNWTSNVGAAGGSGIVIVKFASYS